MTLLLTILSIIAAATLLAVLLAGLLVVFKVLEDVRRHLEQIAMGVRAIERQTAPFGSLASGTMQGLTETAVALEAAAAPFAAADRLVDPALAALRSRS